MHQLYLGGWLGVMVKELIMSEHLDDISTYYFLDPENKMPIKPISGTDAAIIENLGAIIEKMGFEVLTKILFQWKLSHDEQVLEDLELYFNSDEMEAEMDKRGGNFWKKLLDKMKMAFIEIQGESIIIKHIYSIKNGFGYDTRPYWTIVLNQEENAPASYEWYINKEFRFHSEESRDAEVKRIKKLISKNTLTKFVK